MRDILAMGAGVDVRRTFITTDENPFYDAFIRWQFEVLRRQGRVIKAVRCAATDGIIASRKLLDV
jgi:leucyl-tRNA synthetase